MNRPALTPSTSSAAVFCANIYRNVRASFLALPVLAMASTALNAQEVLQSSPEYERIANRLRNAPDEEFQFNRASLRDVLRFLAEASNISYVALPESEGEKEKLITFKVSASPFVALETVANSYGIALILDKGIWHMRPLSDKEMIGRIYKIKHNAAELVTSVQSNSGYGPIARQSQVANNYAGREDYKTGELTGSGGNGGGSGGGAGGGGNLSGANSEFGGATLEETNINLAFNADQLINNVSRIIGLPTSGFDAAINKKEVTIDDFGKDPMRTPQRMYKTSEEAGVADDDDRTPSVFWNSDENSLFVVCTRQQHQLIEAYITSIDKPQTLIAIEVKFFEQNRNPGRDFGVDWSETLGGDGYPISLTQADVSYETRPGPFGDTNYQIETPREDGFSWFAKADDPYFNRNPHGVIFNAQQLRARVRALMTDGNVTSTSYPRVLTTNNREVVIKNVIGTPVLASTSSTSGGFGGINTTSVRYLNIGTKLNLLPKLMTDGTIGLTVALSVTRQTNSATILGQPYPVLTGRTFTAPLRVQNGYTIAIAGLDEASDSTTGNGVPVLSRIPILGHAFKNTNRQANKNSMMIFITPTLVSTGDPGISEKPISTLPVRPNDPERKAPRIYEDGSLAGGVGRLGAAILWADREERYLRAFIDDGMANDETRRDVKLLRKAVMALLKYAQFEQQNRPDLAAKLDLQIWNLQELNKRAAKLENHHWKKDHDDFLGNLRPQPPVH